MDSLLPIGNVGDNPLTSPGAWSKVREKIIVLTVAEYAALVSAGTVQSDVLYIRTP